MYLTRLTEFHGPQADLDASTLSDALAQAAPIDTDCLCGCAGGRTIIYTDALCLIADAAALGLEPRYCRGTNDVAGLSRPADLASYMRYTVCAAR